MQHIKISHQRATAIRKAEGLPMPDLNGSVLLKTGAKLIRSFGTADLRWHISGYADDGSDVAPYHI